MLDRGCCGAVPQGLPDSFDRHPPPSLPQRALRDVYSGLRPSSLSSPFDCGPKSAMALKIKCPHCQSPRRLEQPYPMPGAELHCLVCGHTLAITYPPGMVERLAERGVLFDDPSAGPSLRSGAYAEPPPPAPSVPSRPPMPTPNRARPPGPAAPTPPALGHLGAVPSATPALPSPSPAPAPSTRAATPISPPAPTRPPAGEPARPPAVAPPRAETRAPQEVQRAARVGTTAPPRSTPPAPPAPAPAKSRLGWFARLLVGTVLLGLFGAVGAAVVVAGVVLPLRADLPTVDELGKYNPPSVTVVYDVHGKVLGEVYEKRRYVKPLEAVPQHVQDAFLAAEDANFWSHGGVDYEGIVRAFGRNALKGRKAQGASTITMQVARNFLLSSEKTYERKIKEILLSWRIEETFDKRHILYLYLNQIYLGSGAYGVEAASRTYFGKGVADITLAEAAILAGLPQRPSDYSPHIHWEKARVRQEYVLGQMLEKGYIDAATHRATLEEAVSIHRAPNEFLTQAPSFTEHVRRYLVNTYGFDKIYNDGLAVHTTCDLELQEAAQRSLVEGVTHADNLVGWRGAAENVGAGGVEAALATQESALLTEAAEATLVVGPPDKGGFGPRPARSSLVEGRRYPAVVKRVDKGHAIVGIGAHEAIIPLSWSKWAYPPNPDRSFKSRAQDSMLNVLKVGDRVEVDVAGLDWQTFDNLKGYKAAGSGPYAAARLYQKPDLEGAFFGYRQSDGAVLSMVGGVDFAKSEFNRVTQARRQVGSTFKPIVYAAAIATREVTAGTVVQDAPTAFATIGGLWKPGNYGEDYLGNITLRRALQMSRNTCTVRVLDRVGLEPIFQMAGPQLRIGYDEPACTRTHQKLGTECKGTTTPSRVAGMEWCEHCEADSCPLVKAGRQSIRIDGASLPVGEEMRCMDEAQTINGEQWCHSCDVNLRVCDSLKLEQIPSTDPCVDARRDSSGQVWCRSCDLSMGLGSSSLTMVELVRAYSAFATYGRLVEPHWINRVEDRDGTVIEEWTAPADGWPEAIPPGVAGVGHFLLREVATGGTAAASNKLGIQVAGKTGTTNDEHDTWFVGYDPEIVAAAWVGYDQPRKIGQSFTGGHTALPIWMDYMKVASPKSKKLSFRPIPGVEMVPIDEKTGRVASGGRAIPMLPGTAPQNTGAEIGQKTAEDLLTTDF